MKKIITTLAVLVAATGIALAQSPSVGASYLNSTKVTKYKNNDPTSAAGSGFAVGGNIEFDLVSGIKVTPGVYFGHIVTKSASDVLGLLAGTGTETENYLMVPVRFSYGYELFDGFKVFAFMGPNFSYCLSSKSLYTAAVTGLGSGETTVDNFDDGSDYQRFDTMVGFGAGLDIMDMIRVAVSYDLGMFDLHADDDYKIHRNQLGVTVSYLF
ncbi:MAG: PorT family protein [Bacteroidales bacterium]|nr:PorT family protein [Bacteroidales bacterium]